MISFFKQAALTLGFTSQLISPIPATTSPKEPISDQPKQIMAFAPFWLETNIPKKSANILTSIAYFSFTIDQNGLIIKKDTQAYQHHLGWHQWINHKHHLLTSSPIPANITLTIKDDQSLTYLLTNQQSQSNFIQELTSLNNFDQIIIDFEPTLPMPTLKSQFNQLIADIDRHISNRIIIAIYASAISQPNLWDLKHLNQHTDSFIVMTYDYHQANSSISGPIAPLNSRRSQASITANIPQISQYIPRSKILLGIPLYGYQWQVTSVEPHSNTIPKSGKFISLKQIERSIPNLENQIKYDTIGLSPYINISDNHNQIIQIHFENQYSISQKVSYVNDAGLGGVALWALGYQPDSDWLWQTLSQLKSLKNESK